MVANQCCQVSNATKLRRSLRGRRWYWLQLPVKVVQSQNLDIDDPTWARAVVRSSAESGNVPAPWTGIARATTANAITT